MAWNLSCIHIKYGEELPTLVILTNRLRVICKTPQNVKVLTAQIQFFYDFIISLFKMKLG